MDGRQIIDSSVVIDQADTLNKLNQFPQETGFQTFLLDKNNRVIALGNPIHNPQIRNLYLKEIMNGKKADK